MTNLQPPGHGLPSLELGLLNTAFKMGTAFCSDSRALKMYLKASQTTYKMVDDCDYDFASTEVLIPRLQGMEDSSRNWSLFMVLDHLVQVDRVIMQVIGAVVDGVKPRGEIDTADVKPSNEVGAEVLEQFLACQSEYEQLLGSLISRKQKLRGTVRFPHPWFGPLDAHGWHCLAAIHQRIHGRQALKIAAMLGRV